MSTGLDALQMKRSLSSLPEPQNSQCSRLGSPDELHVFVGVFLLACVAVFAKRCGKLFRAATVGGHLKASSHSDLKSSVTEAHELPSPDICIFSEIGLAHRTHGYRFVSRLLVNSLLCMRQAKLRRRFAVIILCHFIILCRFERTLDNKSLRLFFLRLWKTSER